VGQTLVGKEVSEIRELLGPECPPFRARQVYHAIYRQAVEEWEEISTLPRELRRELATAHPLGLPREESSYSSIDGTRRYLLTLEDGRSVETVLMPEERRQTACISTQVGCPVNCRFCLTALMGLERNLTVGEIVGQVLFLARRHQLDPRSERFNVVMMGMGEPLLNLPAVIKATRLLVDPEGIAMSVKRITVSTSGIIPKIEELASEPVRPRLAISLNASTEESRVELMPITKKYRLADLLETCRRYPLRPGERLTFEYVLMGGVNDSDQDARRVVKMLANINCKVNLIALNPGPGIPYTTPSEERVLSFQSIVKRSVPCFIRKPRGRDIYAACGQLKRVSLDVPVQSLVTP
jgi:23S rRNA (adenine2503-C2)-methyltransferase